MPSPQSIRRQFEQTALPLLPELHRAAKRLAPVRDDAEDLVQETFLRAYRTFAGFEPGSNCKAWLYTILRTVILNRKRTDVRRPSPDSLDGMIERDSGEEPASMSNLNTPTPAAAKTADCIREAFGNLPVDLRWILLLVDVEEFSYAEVSRVLDCPLGTVSSKVYRARQQMESLLRPEVSSR